MEEHQMGYHPTNPEGVPEEAENADPRRPFTRIEAFCVFGVFLLIGGFCWFLIEVVGPTPEQYKIIKNYIIETYEYIVG